MSESPSTDQVNENTGATGEQRGSIAPKVRAEPSNRRKSAAGRRISVTELPSDAPKNIPGEEINANYKKKSSLDGRKLSTANIANDEAETDNDDGKSIRVYTGKRKNSAERRRSSKVIHLEEMSQLDIHGGLNSGNPNNSRRSSSASTKSSHKKSEEDGNDGDDEKDDNEEEDGEEEEEEEEEVIKFVLEEFIDERNPGMGKQVVEEEWSTNHAKLLYMVSKYATAARSAEESESWIRQLPLAILMYEGIVTKVLDFDYAPASTLVSMDGFSRRLWMNTTQEGKSAIDDLREGKLLNGLKLSTVDFQPVTAFQVSLRGLDAVTQIPSEIKEEVDSFTHTPENREGIEERELLQVRYKSLEELHQPEVEEIQKRLKCIEDEEEHAEVEEGSDDDGFFVLEAENSKYFRRSTVTASEDVSYVSSPYLPTCVRNVRRMKDLTSNYHRREESAEGASNLNDELDEAIVLSNVHAIVGEWIPFGANQIVALNERLGALDRCQGGMFSSEPDVSPCELQLETDPGLTGVRVLDFDSVRFINFEAEIFFPEAEGIVQVENFGIHINVDGTVLYGVYIEAIMERKDDDISLDLLSRLLVDVHMDSSTIMNSLLSKYQRALMDMVFMGDTDHRPKFNMLMSDEVEPFLFGVEYMDRDSNENELKQVIGDLYDVYDVGEHAVLMLGRDGLLFAGISSTAFEVILISYLSMLVREMFIRMFFIRTFVLDGLLKSARSLIITYEQDPNYISEIRAKLNDASRDIISLEALLEYLRESLENLVIPPEPSDPDGRQLFESLSIANRKSDVMNRVIDLRKLIHGARSELQILTNMRDVINAKKLEDVFKDVDGNTKFLVDASSAQERASASLEVMQVVLGGTLGFSIIDRLAGGTMNMDQPDWLMNGWIWWLIDSPYYLWFIGNMLFFVFFSGCVFGFMKWVGLAMEGVMTVRYKLNKRFHMDKLNEFLKTKSLETIDTIQDEKTKIRKATWIEKGGKAKEYWGGAVPKIVLQYDENFQFLLQVVIKINKNKAKDATDDGLKEKFNGILEEAGILLTPEEVQEKEEELAALAEADGEKEDNEED